MHTTPSATPAASPSAAPLNSIVTGLHHVGHVVHDIGAAREVYRRLGFRTPPAAFPALPPEPGAPPRAFGAGNTHADLRSGFVELVTVLDAGADLPEGAQAHELAAEPEQLAHLTRAVEEASGRIRGALERFEGLHILAFEAGDIDSAAAGLTAAGIAHGGVSRLQRPVESAEGTVMEAAAFLELDTARNTPEGRLAMAEAVGARTVAHPNGAFALVEAVMAVPDDEVERYARRYGAYTDRTARGSGTGLVIDLGRSRLVLVGASDLGSAAPGAEVPALPGLAAYGVAVADLDATETHLRTHGMPFERVRDGLVVPAEAALGTAVVFRSSGTEN